MYLRCQQQQRFGFFCFVFCFCCSLHEAPSWISGEKREETSASAENCPINSPLYNKAWVLHLPAIERGAEYCSAKSVQLCVDFFKRFPSGGLELVLQWTGISCSPLLCVCGQQYSNGPVRALGALVGRGLILTWVSCYKGRKTYCSGPRKIWKHVYKCLFFIPLSGLNTMNKHI